MIKQYILHDMVLMELKRCKNLYFKLTDEFNRLPKGSLLNRNGHTYWAYREGSRQVQTPARKSKLIKDLKYKHFIKRALPILMKRIEACRLFLKNEILYDPVSIEQKMKEVYQGIEDSERFLEGDMSLEEWLNEPYIRNSQPFEEEHYTERGVQVRSKAEAMIGTQAEYRGMYFKCEPQKDIIVKLVYPDFEFFLLKTRRRVYLEHFGKMDDPKYAKNVMIKLSNYHRAGLYLGINFFFTWETRDKPLNIKEINEVLDKIIQLDEVFA